MSENSSDIRLFQLSNYVAPKIEEVYGRKWVLNGKNNSFFEYINDRRYGSPTNESILSVYKSLIYGKGIVEKGKDEIYEDLYEYFPKKDIKQAIDDFNEYGMFSVKLVKSRGSDKIHAKHFPIDKLAMSKADEKGEINSVWYSYDWSNIYKNKPIEIKLYKGEMTEKEMILLHKPYQSGHFYYPLPPYTSALMYAEIEEEIANFSINHIKNGLSFGYIINVNNGGSLTPSQKDKAEKRIREILTGSTNAGKFVMSFNNGKEAEITVVPLDVNDAHNQWESLRDHASAQIIKAHGAFPALFGIDTATGFSSNSDELNTQSKLVQDYQITPRQEDFLEAIKPFLENNSLSTDLEFLNLRDSYTDEEKEEVVVTDDTVEDETIELKEDVVSCDNVDMKALLSKGESFSFDDWDVVDDRRCDEITLKEKDLNTVFEFASIPEGDSRKSSGQDTSLFKVRYRYAGNPLPQRQFCKQMMSSNKVFRAEDLINAGAVNPGFGVGGSNTYNIFLYKGGANCKHYFQRVIYLKKGNKKISVNKARKMILELEPKERKDAKWKENDKKVAKIPYDMPNNGYKNPRV